MSGAWCLGGLERRWALWGIPRVGRVFRWGDATQRDQDNAGQCRGVHWTNQQDNPLLLYPVGIGPALWFPARRAYGEHQARIVAPFFRTALSCPGSAWCTVAAALPSLRFRCCRGALATCSAVLSASPDPSAVGGHSFYAHGGGENRR